MAHLLSAFKAGWRSFSNAPPGQRFKQHYQRAQRDRSIARRALRIGLGAVLVAGGVVLWVLPGPGWLLVMFGLAMFAGESRLLASGLDRLELRLRAIVRRVRGGRRTASSPS